LSAAGDGRVLVDGAAGGRSAIGRRSAPRRVGEDEGTLGSRTRRRRPFAALRSAVADYARRVWVNSEEDNVFFLASGIAFNILLAAVPFFLLLISGLGYGLNLSPAASLDNVSTLIDRLLPQES
jgi:hypothetical protein